MPDNAAQQNPSPQPLTFRQPIPTFAGDKDVVDWLRGFERWSVSVGLDEQQRFKAVESALTGKAQDWFALVDRDEPLADWDDFTTKVRRRFTKKTTPQEFCRSLTELKQTKDESVKDFIDRVSKVILMFKEGATEPTTTTDQGKRLVKEARDGVFELLRTSLFTAGLRDNIKTHVLRQSLTSWELVEEAAIRVESAAGGQAGQAAGGRYINAIEGEQGASAMQSRGGGARGRGRGRGRGGRSMQVGRPSWLRDDMLPQGTCYKCGHQGHFGRDCVTKVENFYWAKLAEKVAAERPVAALNWPLQQSWPAPPNWPAPLELQHQAQGTHQPFPTQEGQVPRGQPQPNPRENPFGEGQAEYSNSFQDF